MKNIEGILFTMYIYCLPIVNQTWNEIDFNLLKFVSPERQKKIMSHHFAIDKKLSLYAGLLTRMVLSNLTKIPATKLSFSVLENGKPYLLSTTKYHFNFSHTHNFILCGISSFSPIGVDVERKRTASLDIMKIVFHSSEIQYVQSTSDSNIRNKRFYRIWTQKEAYTKYLGIGLTEEMTNINVLDPKFTNSFFSWEFNKYICSVYSNMSKHSYIKLLSEDDIQNYFYCLFI